MQALGACYVGPNVTYSGYIKLYTNRWVANVLAGDCVQGVHKNVKYGGGTCLKCCKEIFMGLKDYWVTRAGHVMYSSLKIL
jgi:hypothetical protein